MCPSPSATETAIAASPRRNDANRRWTSRSSASSSRHALSDRPPGDATVVTPGDIVKLDCGTHVDGYVTDNATTVDLRDGDNSLLCTASRMALENAIAVMGPGASLTEVGRQVEKTITAMGFQPVRNLCGHGVARFTIHCAPSVPNYPDPRAGKLKPNMTIACEPFASDGVGMIDVDGDAEVFMLKRDVRPKDGLPAAGEAKHAQSATEQPDGCGYRNEDQI